MYSLGVILFSEIVSNNGRISYNIKRNDENILNVLSEIHSSVEHLKILAINEI